MTTRERQKMFDWFAGPGAAFKEPLPKSTNYLNAYDTAGSLVRAPYFKPSDAPDANDAFSDQQQAEQAEKTEKSSEQTQDKQEEEGQAPRRQKSERLLAEQKAARERDQPTGLPAETPDDLMPFPMNRAFRSQAVLSEELREEVYRRIMIERKSVRDVSAALGIEMRRVGAVVRLKALEKQIEDKGEPMARPYANAVLAMLPQTLYIPHDPVSHEPINDLPIHQATRQQIFHPVPEGQHFTRRDAAKVFEKTLLPAEDRIPHPELYETEKWKAEGVPVGERIERRRQANAKEAQRKEAKDRKKQEVIEYGTKVAKNARWDFKFQDISAKNSRGNSRQHAGVGMRYGLPAQDRKRGQIKIPRRVEA